MHQPATRPAVVAEPVPTTAPLVSAASRGDLAEIRSLLDANAEIDIFKTPLSKREWRETVAPVLREVAEARSAEVAG